MNELFLGLAIGFAVVFGIVSVYRIVTFNDKQKTYDKKISRQNIMKVKKD